MYSNRRDFAPPGSKGFPFRVNPYMMQFSVQEGIQDITKVIYLYKNGGQSIKCTLCPYRKELLTWGETPSFGNHGSYLYWGYIFPLKALSRLATPYIW